ncbi:MAG: DUF3786 domain-containing protein [Oscillospiraceae bacterium]|nr:DUF3786 domain-containing protein [Oscillospiraceae bacterium]
MESGYNEAISLAKNKLSELNPEKVCKLCGAKFDGEKYAVKWMANEYILPLSQPNYSKAHEIIFLHYLTSEGTKRPEGKLISYREVPTAAFYAPKFIQRAVMPMVRCFGAKPWELVKTGESLGGARVSEVSESAHSVKMDLLPFLPVTYMMWEDYGEEGEPRGNILFDKTAPGWLCAEDLAVAASLGAYELIGEYKKQVKNKII